jgi:hypothetical protein
VGASLTIARAAAREHATYDLRTIGWPLGATVLAASSGLRLTGLQNKGFDLLLKAHHLRLSAGIDQRIVRAVAEATALERSGRATGLWSLYDEAVNAAVANFRKSPGAGAKRFIGSRILVIKSATPQERGVIVVDYQYVFPLLAGCSTCPPSASGTISSSNPAGPTSSPRRFCSSRNRHGRFRPDHRTSRPRGAEGTQLQPPDRAARRKLVGGSATHAAAGGSARHRRHHGCGLGGHQASWRVFRALADCAARPRLKTVLVGYRYDRTREDIEGLAAHFGIRDQIETYERISQTEVSACSRARRFTSCGRDASARTAPSSKR